MPPSKTSKKRALTSAAICDIKPDIELWGFSIEGVKSEMEEPFNPNREICKLQFASNRFLVHSIFRDVDKIHIREYESKNGEDYPTRKGICLSASRFSSLHAMLPEVMEAVKRMRAGEATSLKNHIGGGVFVTISHGYRCVNIRRFWRPSGELFEVATRNGIAIRLGEFDAFVQRVIELGTISPQVVSPSIICANRDSHFKETSFLECIECSPFQNNLIDI
jgi:Transcriptional Coactivator p15 (PC4)